MTNTFLNKNLFVSIFYDSYNPCLITDRRGVIIEVNKAYEENTGYSCADVKGKWGFIQSEIFKASFSDEEWTKLEKDNHWRGEIWDEKKNGEVYPKTLSINAVYDDNDEITNYYATFFDITRLMESEESFRKLAHYDNLTGLPNRLLFKERLHQAILQAKRNQTSVGIILLDLDSFKIVNDTLGHDAGDALLKVVSNRLSEVIRQTDTIARLGGDEFAFVLNNLTKHEDITIVANNIVQIIRKPITINTNELYVTASMGITTYPQDGTEIDELIKRTDNAMYHAKDKGKDTYRFFSEEMDKFAVNRLGLETRLRRAIKNKEFALFYQPRVNLETNIITSAEALIRWHDPEFGLISPLDFIPLAEETGLIIPIGEWVIEQACEHLSKWINIDKHDIKISVNVSARQFMDFHLGDKIDSVIQKTGIQTKYLELEITESTIVKNIDFTKKMLHNITERGISVAIDDFGTGYSSMSFLKKLPFDVLKIDREFVKDINSDSDDEAITKAIIAMSRGLRLSTVAEGVETKAHYSFLKKEGCTEAQGYYISRPLPVNEFENFLKIHSNGFIDPGE